VRFSNSRPFTFSDLATHFRTSGAVFYPTTVSRRRRGAQGTTGEIRSTPRSGPGGGTGWDIGRSARLGAAGLWASGRGHSWAICRVPGRPNTARCDPGMAVSAWSRRNRTALVSEHERGGRIAFRSSAPLFPGARKPTSSVWSASIIRALA